jgi:LacI family transcriptional regulator
MQDIAKSSGCSAATVSRYINRNGYVAPDKQAAILRAIQELGYKIKTPDISANKSKSIGLIMKKYTNNFYFEKLSQSILNAAEKNNYRVNTLFMEGLTNRAFFLAAKELIDNGAVGLIVSGFDGETLSPNLCNYFSTQKIPIIFMENDNTRDSFDRININGQSGVREAVHHLISKGHSNILYLTVHGDYKIKSLRKEAFLQAIQESHNENIQYLIKECRYDDLEDIYSTISLAFEENPDITGVICWSDLMAAKCLQYLYAVNRRVPDFVEVIGHDDTLAEFLSPPISSVKIPIDEMAEAALSLIASDASRTSNIRAVRSISFDTQLILR